jgi:hypothetical protein
MRKDAERATGEDDLTHLDEVLTLHDLARDPGAPNRQVFEARCRENLSTRAMHHHVFVSRTVVEMCEAAGLEVLLLRAVRPFHIVCLSRVTTGPAGRLAEGELSRALKSSPFASDRQPLAPPGDGLV